MAVFLEENFILQWKGIAFSVGGSSIDKGMPNVLPPLPLTRRNPATFNNKIVSDGLKLPWSRLLRNANFNE